jgi:hypothetical protein
MFTRVTGVPLNPSQVIAGVVSAGALERYPIVRISFGESGIAGFPMGSAAWILRGNTAFGIPGSG